MASISTHSAALSGSSASDLLRSSSNGFSGISLRDLAKVRFNPRRKDMTVSAKVRKVKKHEYPWPADADPNVKGGILTHLSHFKPLKETQKPVTLEFEKPLVLLEKKINDVSLSLLMLVASSGWVSIVFFCIDGLFIMDTGAENGSRNWSRL